MKGPHITRNISRTSSENSGDHMQAQGQNSHSTGQFLIQRLHSFNPQNQFTGKIHQRLEQYFQQNEGEANQQNHGKQPREKEFAYQEDQAHNMLEQHSVGEIYNNYKQMVKDVQFIQMLGNPRYVIELFNQGYLYSKDFKDYLSGLKCFFRKHKLKKLIKYPEGLYNLQKLLKKGFIQSLQFPELRDKFILESLKKNLEIKQSLKKWRNFQIEQNQQQKMPEGVKL